MKVRIGIDVGGTFTDAVVIDNDTYELIGSLKIPTTHKSDDGVAAGIVNVIKRVMEKYSISPEDVVFIAHGTTQATNALLEGDVVPIGIIGLGQGLEALKVKSDTQIGNIELAPDKYLVTFHRFISTDKVSEAGKLINELKTEGAKALVASAAYSVDDPKDEISVIEEGARLGLVGTGSHEISKLYGLKIRTRTAAINASILPKMVETADMTEKSVKQAGIKAPLMIMRCDGGVMDVGEVRKRPILTMLSGPAAGVAGALMYEKISDGIFLEVGGTSTDISAVKNGRVMVKYAEVGGHKTYLNSLDVRTVGIGGGSMIRVGSSGVEDVGPRSAHIAGLEYAVYAETDEIADPEIILYQPNKGDPSNYAAIKCSNGKTYAITISCAANILGFVDKSSYAYGNGDAARKAFEPFAKKYGITVEEFAKQIMKKASEKNEIVVKSLLKDYDLNQDYTVLVGGGGGSAAVVPCLAEHMGLNHRIAKNAEVISPIGVALAMVRDMVERNISNPTEEDILKVRKEAEDSAIKSGAAPGSVEIHVEVDAQKNIVRAIAVGTTELRTKDLTQKSLTDDEMIAVAQKTLNIPRENIKIDGDTGYISLIKGINETKKFMGLIKKTVKHIIVIDREGVIRLQKRGGEIYKINSDSCEHELASLIESSTKYRDGGPEIPDIFIFHDRKIIDLSGLVDKKQILSLAKVELKGLSSNKTIYVLASDKSNS